MPGRLNNGGSGGTHDRARDLRTHPAPRQHVFTLKLFESEARELRQMSQANNRQPGEQLRAILQAAIRQWRKAPDWIPEELDR